MKRNIKIYILILCLSSVLFVNMKCKKAKQKYTIAGTAYLHCNEPLANTQLTFVNNPNSGYGDTIGTSTTDANGNYSFTYETKSGTIDIMSHGVSSNTDLLMKQIPSNQNIDGLDIYVSVFKQIEINLECANSLSNLDTLYIHSYFDVNQLVFNGPFVNNSHIATINGDFSSNNYNERNTKSTFITYIWGVGYLDFKKASDSYFSLKYDYHFVKNEFVNDCTPSLTFNLKIN